MRLNVYRHRESFEEFARRRYGSVCEGFRIDDEVVVSVAHIHRQMSVVRFMANSHDHAYEFVEQVTRLPPHDTLADLSFFSGRLHS